LEKGGARGGKAKRECRSLEKFNQTDRREWDHLNKVEKEPKAAPTSKGRKKKVKKKRKGRKGYQYMKVGCIQKKKKLETSTN